jgi:hypothetical protein
MCIPRISSLNSPLILLTTETITFLLTGVKRKFPNQNDTLKKNLKRTLKSIKLEHDQYGLWGS